MARLFPDMTTAPRRSIRQAIAPSQIVQLWNEQSASPSSRLRPGRLTEKRRVMLRRRLAEHNDIEIWRTGIKKIFASDFCAGENDRGWRATFEFICIRPDAIVNAIEGKYDNRPVVFTERERADLRAFHRTGASWLHRCPVSHGGACNSQKDCETKIVLGWRSEGGRRAG